MQAQQNSADSALAVLEEVRESAAGHAERISNQACQEFPVAASPGDTFRQGDIYIVYLGEFPADIRERKSAFAAAVRKVLTDNAPHLVDYTSQSLEKTKPPVNNQLAPGNTQGARHCLECESATWYSWSEGTTLAGPVVDLQAPGTVTHPEHGHVKLPEGTYAITFQRARAEELRRVRD